MYTNLLKNNIIYWLSAFKVPTLSMLLLSFLLLSSSSCCLPGTGPVFVAEFPAVLYIHWKNRVLKKRSSIEGENFRLCIDFYICCWVNLSEHRVSLWVSAWGIPLVPRTYATDTQGVMLGLVQAWIKLYTDMYAYLYIIKVVWCQK